MAKKENKGKVQSYWSTKQMHKSVTLLKESRIPFELLEMCKSSLTDRGFSIEVADYAEDINVLRHKLLSSEAVFCCPGRYLDDSTIEIVSKKVKLFQLWSSGFDKFNISGCEKFGVAVCNNGGANSTSVAEHTVMLILAGSRGLNECLNRVKKGLWAGNRHGLDYQTLINREIGIIGLGNIGKKVAARLYGFGCRLSYFDVRRNLEAEHQLGLTFKPLKELCAIADIITLHLHANAQTENLLSRELLG